MRPLFAYEQWVAQVGLAQFKESAARSEQTKASVDGISGNRVENHIELP